MFKRFTKSLLEKEVISERPSDQAPLERLLQNSPFSSYSPQESFIEEDREDEPEVVIGEGVTMKGSLTFQTLLRVDGSFEGEISSSGKIVVGPSGHVKANLNLKEAFIAGKVEGNITVSERLALRGRAHVEGDITAPLLSVDEGVSIVGALFVTQESSEPKA